MSKELYHCKSCGFISTHRKEYDTKEGVLFCKSCLALWNDNLEPEHTWVEEALQANRVKHQG